MKCAVVADSHGEVSEKSQMCPAVSEMRDGKDVRPWEATDMAIMGISIVDPDL